MPNAPAYEKGSIAVFAAGTPDMPAYDIVDARRNPPITVRAKAAAGGLKLGPDDIYNLYVGNDCAIPVMRASGPGEVFVFSKGIQPVPREKNAFDDENHYLDFGLATPLLVKDGERAGEVDAYRFSQAVDQPGRRAPLYFVTCRRHVGPENDPIELGAGQAWKLFLGETVEIPGRGKVSLDGIEAELLERGGRTYENYTMRLQIEWTLSRQIGAFRKVPGGIPAAAALA